MYDDNVKSDSWKNYEEVFLNGIFIYFNNFKKMNF
jgi:hypothetical protein